MQTHRTEDEASSGGERPLAPAPHGHKHAHPDSGEHRHPHHHDSSAVAGSGHEHVHTLGFERYTYLISPIHDLDPRFKLVAGLLVIVGTVAGPPMRLPEFLLLTALLLTLFVAARIPLRWILTRSLIVIPIALSIAVFAPLGRATSLSWSSVGSAYAQYGWLIGSIVSKAWLSALVVLLISATTPAPRLFKGLEALHMPAIFLTMLTFLYRFADVLGEQLRSMQRAVASRAPGLRGVRLFKLYGNLAGNLFIRAYERGERVYAAMLSRGYTGVLPTAETLEARPADWLGLATALLVVAALLLY